VLIHHERPEGVRDFQPPFVVDLGRIVSPKHELLHIAPHRSTR
jgi:hypothetical protein